MTEPISGRRASAAGLVLAALVCSSLLSFTLRASSETPPRISYQRQNGKVHPQLYQLRSGRPRTADDAPDLRAAGTQTGDGFVSIAAFPTRGRKGLLADLELLGLEDATADRHVVNGRLPIESIDSAGELATLRYMRPEWVLSSAVAGQGDTSVKGDVARTAFGVTGAGVTVGTLSDSFGCRGSSSGEFTEVRVLKEGPCEVPVDDNGPVDEGRAMIEHVADIAPGAAHLFRTAKLGPVDFAKGIIELKDAGARVIVDDIGYPSEPWFRDGVVAQAVDSVASEGVAYFSAAGNSGSSAYEAPFRDSGIRVGPADSPLRAHDFDAGAGVDVKQRITVPPGDIAVLAFQWDDNFKALGPNGAAPNTDLDIVPFGEDGSVIPLSIPGAATNADEPFEVMLVLNPTTRPLPVDLVIVRVSGPDPAMMKWIQLPLTLSVVTVEEHATPEAGTIFGHPQAFGAMALGAASYAETPAFGKAVPLIEKYSSSGGGAITTDVAGKPIGAVVQPLKPTFVAPDNANTSFFGEDTDADGLPNFRGTSAAAPHAAAVAALGLEKVPTATPNEICNALATTAIDMDKPGADLVSGHGLIDANAALTELIATTKQPASDRCKTVGIAIDSPTTKEGNDGTTIFQFKVTKLGKATTNIDVDYETSAGTATESTDFTRVSGTVSLAPTDVSKTIDVPIVGDADIEPDETFDISIKLKDPAPTSVLLANAFGTATIEDDDNPASNVDTSKLNFVAWGEASPSRGSPGDEVKISGTGFKPETALRGTFHSTPVSLGSIDSDVTGSFVASAGIPDVQSGKHHIEVTGENATGGTRTIRYPVTVVNGSSPAVAATGSSGGVTVDNVGTVTSVLPQTTTGAPLTATSPTSLPRTGANVTFFAELGSLLIVVGGAATYGSRRRRRVAE